MKGCTKLILSWVLLLFLTHASFAQRDREEKEEVLGNSPLVETNEVGVLYEHMMSVGFFSHSNGFGMNYRRGKNTTGYTKRIMEIEAATIKHSKEYKVYHPTREGKGYIFGKSNALLSLRGAIGQQRVIASKTDMGGIEIRYLYMAGVSMGILKPVYLKIEKDVPHSSLPRISIEQYDPAKHGIHNINGKAPTLRGIDELKILPGGFAKLGLSFEYGHDPESVRTLEAGMMLDAYYKTVPIMYDINDSDGYNPNNQFFFGFYVSLNYGKRW